MQVDDPKGEAVLMSDEHFDFFENLDVDELLSHPGQDTSMAHYGCPPSPSVGISPVEVVQWHLRVTGRCADVEILDDPPVDWEALERQEAAWERWRAMVADIRASYPGRYLTG